MIRKTFLLILGFCLISGVALMAQNAPVTMVGSLMDKGPVATVPVTVTGFSNISSFNLILEYDPAIATATGVVFNSGLSGGFPLTDVSQSGKVFVTWMSGADKTLPDGALLFEVTFTKKKMGSTLLTWDDSDVPGGYATNCEYTANSGTVILNDLPYSIYYQSGKLVWQDSGPFTYIEDNILCLETGSLFTVPVKVNGLNDPLNPRTVGALSLALDYNTNLLEFVSVANSASLPSLKTSATDGTFYASAFWGSTPLSGVPDGTALLTLTFKYLGTGEDPDLTWNFLENTNCEYANGTDYIPYYDTPESDYYDGGTITVNMVPTITLGPNPSVGEGVTAAKLNFTATTYSPDEYSIDWADAAFTDVPWTAMPEIDQFNLFIPGTLAPGSYTGTLRVRVNGTGCMSVGYPITLTVRDNPVTYIEEQTVCLNTGDLITVPVKVNKASEIGALSLALNYDPAKLDYQSFAPEGVGTQGNFTVNESGNTLFFSAQWLGSPLALTDGSILFNVTFKYLGTGGNTTLAWNFTEASYCEYATGAPYFIPYYDTPESGFYDNGTITVNMVPTITLGPNPSVGAGVTAAKLNFTATTYNPNEYSIDWADGAFTDVPWTAMPEIDQFNLFIPGTLAPGSYTGTLLVRVSGTGCVSVGYPITLTVRDNPVTLIEEQTVCLNTGDLITVPVKVNKASEIGALSLALNYDPAKLDYQSFAPEGVGTQGNFTVNESGNTLFFSAQWLGSPLALTDGSVLFNVTFSYLGTGGNTTLTWSFTEASNCEYATGAPYFIPYFDTAESEFYDNGTITVNMVPTITLGPNPSVGAGVTAAKLNFTATTYSPDEYSIDWADGAFTDVPWTAMPEIDQFNLFIPGTLAPGSYTGTLRVRVSGTLCESVGYPFTLTVRDNPVTYIDDVTICSGSEIVVPVKVSDFTAIGALSLVLNFDATQLDYLSYEAVAIGSGGNFTVNESVNTLSFSAQWPAASLSGLADESVLFNIRFRYIGNGGTTLLSWDDSGDANCEYATESPYYIPYFDDPTATYYEGATITGLEAPMISFGFNGVEAGHNPEFTYCYGTSLTISLYGIYGGVGPYDVTYTINGGTPVMVEDATIGTVLGGPEILAAGIYTFAVTDITDANGCKASADFLSKCVATVNMNYCGVYLKTILQGAYDSSTGLMRTTLNSSGYLPLAQPYAGTPLAYAGSETVTSFNSNVVDWVVVELRTGIEASTMVARKAALLLDNGDIVSPDQVNAPVFPEITTGDFYVVIYHRNHLPVMTASPITLPNSPDSPYDFTTSPSIQVYGGNNGVIPVGADVYGQIAGDVNMDKRLRYSGSNNDKRFVIDRIGSIIPSPALTSVVKGYYPEDTNFDTRVIYSGANNDPIVVFLNIDHFTDPMYILNVVTGVVPVSWVAY